MLSLTGDGKLVVSRSMSAVNPPKRIAVIDRAKMTGEEIDILFPRPHPMAVVKGVAYTASLGVNQLASIDLASGKVDILNVDGPPHGFVQFAVSPYGDVLAVSTEVSGRLMLFDLQPPAKPKLVKSIEIGKMAFDPVFTADGEYVWVPAKMNNEIAIVSMNSGTVETRITDPAFRQPHQIVFSPDRTTAFVTNNNKMDHMADPAHAGHAMPGADGTASLVVVDVATRKVTKSIPLGKNLTGMGTWAR
jgi:DNA-binding beta-propeller fold protein YncE